MWYKQFSLPLQLTLLRLIGSPLILPFFLVYLLPYNNVFLNVCLTLLFLFFGITDFLDGYLARKYNQTTVLGGMLDHIADKFLLYATLIALVAVHKIHFIWAILWIGREFLIMTLRQIALEQHFSVSVSSYGKIKTCVQIICMAVIIANPYQGFGLCHSWWNVSELILLLVATFLSFFSAYDYLGLFYKKQDLIS